MSILTKSTLFPLLPDNVRGRVTENHRLSPSSRLKNRKQAGEFILERCFVSVYSGTELPSIQEAIDGRSDLSGGEDRISTGQGIASIWMSDLPDAVPCLIGTFVKRKPTLIARKHWAALLAMEREGFQGARERNRISPAAFRLADCIEREGPATGQVLRDRLAGSSPMDRRTFRRALQELEKLWLIVPGRIGRNIHDAASCVWELTKRWVPDDTVREALSMTRRHAMGSLLLGAVDSAGAVDEKAVYRWFGWPRSMTGVLMDEALSAEACFRVDGPNPVIISSALADIWPES